MHQPNIWLVQNLANANIFPRTKSRVRQGPCAMQKFAREFSHDFDFRLSLVSSTILRCQCDIQIKLENCLLTP